MVFCIKHKTGGEPHRGGGGQEAGRLRGRLQVRIPFGALKSNGGTQAPHTHNPRHIVAHPPPPQQVLHGQERRGEGQD